MGNFIAYGMNAFCENQVLCHIVCGGEERVCNYKCGEI